MRILQPVIWAKGTFLSPQHLQVQDRFVESVLQFRMEALQFRPWGFSRLRINQEALASGVFAIHEAEGLFPDGLPFDIPGSDPAPAVKPLGPYFDPGQTSIDVSLAIPDFRVSGVNLSMRERGMDTRYLSEEMCIRDRGFHGLDVHVHLPLVIGRAAAVEVAVALGRLEGRGVP